MKGALILECFIGIIFMMSLPNRARACGGKPTGKILFNHAAIHLIQTDTIPPPQKPNEDTKDDVGAVTIKTVPKARRQQVPVPLVKIKPVKIIKPNIKIIKPVIRVLH
ncbi:hypothetical protein FW778_00385 [Ginsengibacter hankyongi]|uniref:Uncharacterized protein n=1 Tax=Ginsengibacter hankyongi TaxID=2607284 RepID=A0A5J5IIE1_9BACT|nr:hypothetical protein [Ginsengibacter hankyongi]KAA9040541.1 hypothetical protein FW778_00385 [Ginsengibacter hankyongi]